MGLLATGMVLVLKRASPLPVFRAVSWSVLALVAGLFLLVEALNRTGLIAAIAAQMHALVETSVRGTAAVAGVVIALASNLMNNLPAGLVASAAIAETHPPQKLVDALLIGVDLGPNLSVTSSLATILWLTALRREGVDVSFLRFVKTGALVMPPALLLT